MFPWSTTKVRIGDDVRDCVVFLGDGAPDGSLESFKPAATGFIVRVMDRTEAPPYFVGTLFLVTNKHCVVRRLSVPFHIRMNAKGGSVLVHVEDPEWHFHSSDDVDLAVMEFCPPQEAKYGFLLSSLFVPERVLSEGRIGPDDMTYTVGLFTHHSGAKKENIPLVHTGHIATMPTDEEITVRDWDNSGGTREIEAYVVQCSAMPGASGSPVFVRMAVVATDEAHRHDGEGRAKRHSYSALEQPPLAYGKPYLLGIWQGAWEVGPVRVNGSTPMRDPSGYDIVVSAQKLLEIFDVPKIKAGREAKKKAVDDQSLPVTDSAFPSKTAPAFDATLRAMLNTPPDHMERTKTGTPKKETKGKANKI